MAIATKKGGPPKGGHNNMATTLKGGLTTKSFGGQESLITMFM